MLAQAASAAPRSWCFPSSASPPTRCDDLLQQIALLDASEAALRGVVEASAEPPPVADRRRAAAARTAASSTARWWSRAAACSASCRRRYLPNYREFYEERQFALRRGACRTRASASAGRTVPFGTDLIFAADDLPLRRSTSRSARTSGCRSRRRPTRALAGATVLVNLSASTSRSARRTTGTRSCASQSARCLAAYLYSAAGPGESTTDLAWDGQALIYESGDLLAESRALRRAPRDSSSPTSTSSASRAERMRQNSFGDSVAKHDSRLRDFRRVAFELDQLPRRYRPLQRDVERFPYVPADPAHGSTSAASRSTTSRSQALRAAARSRPASRSSSSASRAGSIRRMRCSSRARRWTGSGCRARTSSASRCRASRRATRPRATPGALMAALGVHRARRSTSGRAAGRCSSDIGHPFAERRAGLRHHVRERAGRRAHHATCSASPTSTAASCVGTGDLSRAGARLVHLRRRRPHVALQRQRERAEDADPASGPLGAPTAAGSSRRPTRCSTTILGDRDLARARARATPTTSRRRSTEDCVGPYELQDFHLYYRRASAPRRPRSPSSPSTAWHDAERGRLAATSRTASADAYDARRDQAAGSASSSTASSRPASSSARRMPNGPKVGSGGSLSPRGDWRAPSDSSAAAWLRDLDNVP